MYYFPSNSPLQRESCRLGLQTQQQLFCTDKNIVFYFLFVIMYFLLFLYLRGKEKFIIYALSLTAKKGRKKLSELDFRSLFVCNFSLAKILNSC